MSENQEKSHLGRKIRVQAKSDVGIATTGSFLALVLVCASAICAFQLFDFLRNNPTADFVQGDAGVYWSEAGRIAAGRIVDSKPFLSIPLYTLFLAGIRAIGGGLVAVYLIQAVLRIATAWMIARLAAEKIDRTVGLVACALFLLLEEPAFYVTRLLPGTLQLFLVAALMLAAQTARALSRSRSTLIIGLLTGLLALSYPPALLMVILLPFCRIGRTDVRQRPIESIRAKSMVPSLRESLDVSEKSVERFTPRMAGLLAAVFACITILPVTALNWMACSEFIPITGHAGITFLQGNSVGASGVYTSIPGISEVRENMHSDAARLFAQERGHPGSYSEMDRYFFQRGIEYLTSNPIGATWLGVRKIFWFFTGRHYSDIYYPSLERADGYLRTLWFSPIATAWLMGSAGIGLWIMRRLKVLSLIDAAMVAIPLLVVAVFWFSPRYRLPAILPLVVASAVFVVWLARLVARKPQPDLVQTRHLHAFTVIATTCAITFWILPIVNQASGFDEPAAYRPQYEYNWGQLFLGHNDFEAARSHFAVSDQLDPNRPQTLTALTTTLVQLDRPADAEAALRRLVTLDPDSASTWLTVGGMLLRYERWPEAQSVFKRAMEIDSTSSGAHLGLWLSFNGIGKGDEEIEHLRRAVELDNSSALAVCEYGFWLAAHGPPQQAQQQIQRCLTIAPDSWDRSKIQGALQSLRDRNH